MKRNLTAILSALLLAACEKIENSAEMTEPATVSETIFVPSQHGSGTGISSKGSAVFTSVEIPQKFAVVFECQHGKFIIEGEDERHYKLWKKLKRGQLVTVRYREVYSIKKTGERALKKYDFIDAN